MSKRDYYELLEVSRSAADEELKKAFRKLAMQHHPDRHAGDKKEEEIFKQINEAYSVLSDPEKRRVYDQYGHEGLTGGAGGFEGFGGVGDIFTDIFEGFFGGGQRGGNRAQRGADLRYDLEIPFEEAIFGVEKKLTLPKEENCGACNGSGARSGADVIPCDTCRGSGQVRIQQGFFTLSRTCHVCKGAGKKIKNLCPECRGEGRIAKKKTLSVKIPGGVETGSRLRLTGEGDPGSRGGHPGDLYVFITVQDHEYFQRIEDNLLCDVFISFPQAALGATLEVPTLKGQHPLKIPVGTPHGKIFTLKGLGAPRLKGHGIGDQLVRINIHVPEKLTARQRELLEELESLTLETKAPGEKSFLKRVKNLF